MQTFKTFDKICDSLTFLIDLVSADTVERLCVERQQIFLLTDDVDDVIHVADELVSEHCAFQHFLVSVDRILSKTKPVKTKFKTR